MREEGSTTSHRSRVSAQPPRMDPAPRHPRYVYVRRRVVFGLALMTLSYGLYLGVTLAVALTNQSYGVSFSARGAEWGREHGMGWAVTWVEQRYYSINKPKTGGTPESNQFGSGSTAVDIPRTGHLPAPTTVVTPAKTPQAGEGVWHPVGRKTASGIPAIYEAFIRPDAVHTSYVVGLAWMDPTLLEARLYSGSFIPGGGPYKHSAPILPKTTGNLVAAFNAGFRMQDANGGYYTDNKAVIPLRKGGATVVIFKDGTMTVGQWGRDIKMSSEVREVRQNLDLIVDDSRPVAGLDSANTKRWGATLGGKFDVWRSGIGVTENGALVYAGGPALTISALADVLLRAGAVRAMELDINTDWVQYSIFTAPLGTTINGGHGKSLVSTMVGPPSRYFTTWWNRDFFTVSLRPSETTVTTTTKP